MRERYDVIVVGGGTAGLLSAKALCDNGLTVAVIDRKADLTVLGRTCGQSLLPPNEYFFGNLFHYNEAGQKFCFPDVGLSVPYTGAVKNLYTWNMFSPGMNKMQFGGGESAGPAPIALSYDKEIMLKCMLDEIKSDQVDIFPDTEFTDMVFQGDCVMVQAGEQSFCGSYVIAADGTNSRVVEKLGYNTNRRRIANLYVKSCFVKGFNPPAGDSIITGIHFLENGPVYVFLLPRPEGGDWNFLVLTFEPSIDLDAAMDTVMKGSGFAPWFKEAETGREFAAVEAIYSPVVKPFRNNVMITGDAGSCQELECLGAMITGWKAGLAMAGALKEQQLGVMPRAIAGYEDWWLNTYIKQYDHQDYLSVFGIAYVFSKPDVVDYMFGLMGEPFAPTFNPYTAVKLLAQRMQGLFPKIMAERPDVLQQLAGNMSVFPSDLLSQTIKST
jgi:flavin-dependent dehydrogenase